MDDYGAFLIDTYKHMDAMKTQLSTRFEELEGDKPTLEELQHLCRDVWRLTTFHIAAWHASNGDDDIPPDQARYIPPELSGERAERILAMDERLQHILGDTVEIADADGDEEDDEDDESSFDFEPDADEQVTMAEYGSIIVQHRWFVEQLNELQLAHGDDGYLLNIIQLHTNGFDAVMGRLWELLQDQLRLAH